MSMFSSKMKSAITEALSSLLQTDLALNRQILSLFELQAERKIGEEESFEVF